MRRARITALAAAWLLALCGTAAAATTPAELADPLAAHWAAVQNADGTFPDSIRPGTHTWGRYGEAGVGYGLILAGVRTARPDWIEAGARAQAYAAVHAVDRLSVFESMLMASGYNLLRRRAPATPTFAAQRALWEEYLRGIKPVYNARVDAPQLHSNKYIVEAVANFELARSGLRSDVPGAVLATPGEARRRGRDILNRIVPARIRSLRATVAGHRVTALSDRDRQPLAYHALTAGLLARAIDVAGPAASRAARRALRIGVRTMWAYQAPDGDLAYFGRSQGQSWAPALGAYAAIRAAAPGPCGPRPRAFQGVADRALGRLAARHPIGAGGMAIVPAANGPATVPAIDDYASEVVYNGLTLTALGWAAGARPSGCRAGRTLAARPRGAARAPVRGRALRDRPRRAACGWRSSSPPSRPTAAPRSGSARSSTAAATAAGPSSCPLRRRLAGGPPGSFGPFLRLRSGALARPAGREIEVRRGRILVHGGWVARGRWVRKRVTFRFVPIARGARVVVPTRRGDRIVYSALTAGRPRPTARGVAAGTAGTSASAAATVALSGPFASSSSLDLWRSDLEVRARGRTVRFAVRAR